MGQNGEAASVSVYLPPGTMERLKQQAERATIKSGELITPRQVIESAIINQLDDLAAGIVISFKRTSGIAAGASRRTLWMDTALLDRVRDAARQAGVELSTFVLAAITRRPARPRIGPKK